MNQVYQFSNKNGEFQNLFYTNIYTYALNEQNEIYQESITSS